MQEVNFSESCCEITLLLLEKDDVIFQGVNFRHIDVLIPCLIVSTKQNQTIHGQRKNMNSNQLSRLWSVKEMSST